MTEQEKPNELKQTALNYFKMGLCVLPLTGYRKYPIFDWTPWETKLPTADEIEKWFSDPNLTGIGLLCGPLSGVGVVDDDNYKSGNPLPISSTIEVLTASGGRHLYFKYNPSIPNVDRFSDGFTGEIRNKNKVVVLPPSKVRNKKNEIGEYRWSNDALTNITELPNLTEELVTPFLLKPTNQYPTLHELIDAPEGVRHNSLLQIAQLAYRRFKPNEWDIASDFIRDRAAKFNPPLPENEVERIISDGANFRLKLMASDNRRPHVGVEEMSVDPAWNGEFNDNTVGRNAGYQFNPQKLEELHVEEHGVDYLWDGVIAKGRITILAAFAKAGKTTLISHMIKQMDPGGELAGQFVVPTKVLILSEENPSDWVERKKELNLGDNVRMQCYPVLGALNEKQWMNMMNDILSYCQTEGIELVIFDTISGMWSVEDENSSVQINRAFYGLRLLAQKNLGVLLVHHTTKKEAKGGKAVRGSGAINANCDFIAEFDRNGSAGAQRKLKVISRLRKEFSITIELVNDSYMVVGNARRPSWENNANALLSLIPNAEPGLTITQLHEGWDTEVLGKKPDIRTVDRYIKQLLKRGRVVMGQKVKVAKTEATTYLKAFPAT